MKIPSPSFVAVKLYAKKNPALIVQDFLNQNEILNYGFGAAFLSQLFAAPAPLQHDFAAAGVAAEPALPVSVAFTAPSVEVASVLEEAPSWQALAAAASLAQQSFFFLSLSLSLSLSPASAVTDEFTDWL